MEPFRYHVYACDQQKPEGLVSCSVRGSARTIDALRKAIAAEGLVDEVQVTSCGSLGLCERGPNMVVYPEGTWYSGVTPEDVPEIVQSHFRDGVPVERLVSRDGAALKAEIRANRDKMLMGMRAREAAGALPDDLYATVRGFMESRVVLTALELDLFTAVGKGATAGEAAQRAGTDPRATEAILNALVAMGLLAKADVLYSVTPVTGRYFAAGGEHEARVATLHNASLWERWSRLTDAVRGGTAPAFTDEGERGAEWTVPFIAAMHRIARERTRMVVGAVGVDSVKRVLDVGGGSGAYAIAFAQASPQVEVDLLDRPDVLEIAARHVGEAGLADRVHLRPGDLTKDALGEGYDLVLLSAICHSLDEEGNEGLVRRCREALAPGGRLVISEFILDEDGTGPKFAALFSLNMLVGTKGGASYPEGRIASWMSSAGLSDVRRIRLPGPAHLVVGTRPVA